MKNIVSPERDKANSSHAKRLAAEAVREQGKPTEQTAVMLEAMRQEANDIDKLIAKAKEAWQTLFNVDSQHGVDYTKELEAYTLAYNQLKEARTKADEALFALRHPQSIKPYDPANIDG